MEITAAVGSQKQRLLMVSLRLELTVKEHHAYGHHQLNGPHQEEQQHAARQGPENPGRLGYGQPIPGVIHPAAPAAHGPEAHKQARHGQRRCPAEGPPIQHSFHGNAHIDVRMLNPPQGQTQLHHSHGRQNQDGPVHLTAADQHQKGNLTFHSGSSSFQSVSTRATVSAQVAPRAFMDRTKALAW